MKRTTLRGLLILTFFIVGLITTFWGHRTEPPPPSATPLPVKAPTPPHTVEWLSHFYDRHLYAVIQMLHDSRLPFPLLREEQDRIGASILQRYKKRYVVGISSEYHPSEKVRGSILGAAGALGTKTGSPTVFLHVPAAKDFFETLQRENLVLAQERFKNTVTIIYLHEMQHLGSGLIDEVDQKINLAFETKVWARTCADIIVPMIEVYHLEVGPVGKAWYDAWLRAGRDENNPLWLEEVRKWYE